MEVENKDRRMFAIYKLEGIYFAEQGDPRYHIQWFADMKWIDNLRGTSDPVFEQIVRGYIAPDGTIVAYKGKDFSHFGCRQAISKCAQAFIDNDKRCTPDSKVKFGHNGHMDAGILSYYLEDTE